MKKNIIIYSILVIALFMLYGCNNTITYEESDFKITLPKEFKEKNMDTFKYYYQHETNIITVTSENFSGLINAVTNTDYLKDAVNNSGKSGRVIEKEKYSYVSYDSNDYYHIAAVIKGTDSFWTINAMCLNKDKSKYEKLFLKWIESIEVK